MLPGLAGICAGLAEAAGGGGGGGFPVVESVTTGFDDTNGTSYSVVLPATVAAGDLLIVLFARDGNSGTITWDNSTAGAWTALFNVNHSSASVSGHCYYKVADGTEDGLTLTINTSASEQAAWHIYRISNFQGVPEVATGSTTGWEPPNLAPSWGADDALWLAAAMHNIGDTANHGAAPTDFTDYTYTQTATSAGVGIGSARRELNASSLNPTQIRAVIGDNSDFAVMATIAVRAP